MLKFNTNEKNFLKKFQKDNIRTFIENFEALYLPFDTLNDCKCN